MPDYLPAVLQWVQQGYRPIPCTPRGKRAAATWARYQRQDPTAHDRHRWWPGKGHTPANVALILGPKPGGNLLALNVNIKHGHDGPATLRRLGWRLPPTPTIRTASGGTCYFFQPPDSQFYPSPFGTHVHPDGYDGLEFRGTGGYQVVPPSVTEDGAYAFVPPWTLDRFCADLAPLPGALLQAWIMFDQCRANFSAPARPEHIGKPHKRANDGALPIDLSSLPPPRQRSRWRPPPTATPPLSATPPISGGAQATTTTQHLTTITTPLSSDDYSDFAADEGTYDDRACASFLCGLVALDDALLENDKPFCCCLPGHRESEPSATWFRTDSRHFIYHDWHVRSGEKFWPVPDVFAALVTGQLKKLPKPSRKTWRLRLMVEAGLLAPYPVEMKPLPDDMPALLRRFCEGFYYLCACKWTYQERAPTMFGDAFAAGWCGIREGSIWKLRRLALAHGFLVAARDDEGRKVYLPGKEMHAT